MTQHVTCRNSMCGLEQSGSQLRTIPPTLTPMHLATSAEILFVTTMGSRFATAIKWVQARDANKYPTMHKAALYNKELSSLIHQ